VLDGDGQSPIHWLLDNPRDGVAKEMLEAFFTPGAGRIGANVGVKSVDGWT